MKSKKIMCSIVMIFIFMFIGNMRVFAVQDTTCSYGNVNIKITTNSDGTASFSSGNVKVSNASDVTTLTSGGYYVCPNYILYKAKTWFGGDDKIYVSNSKTYLETLDSEKSIGGSIYTRSTGANESIHKVATCKYAATTSQSSSSGKGYYKTNLTLNIFDDNTSYLTYETDSGTYNSISYINAHLKTTDSVSGVSGSILASHIDISNAYSLYKDSSVCPAVEIDAADLSNVSISLIGSGSNDCKTVSSFNYCTESSSNSVTTSPTDSTSTTANDSNGAARSCSTSINSAALKGFSSSLDIDPGLDFFVKIYSDGNYAVCFQKSTLDGSTSNATCSKVGKSGIISIGGYIGVYTINATLDISKTTLKYSETNCPTLYAEPQENGNDNYNFVISTTQPTSSNYITMAKGTYSIVSATASQVPATTSTVSGCAELLGPNVIDLLTTIFKMIQIIGPIAALGLGMYDMLQALASGEDEAKKKAFKKLGKRIAAAVLLLLLPYIVNFILSLIPSLKGSNCLNI